MRWDSYQEDNETNYYYFKIIFLSYSSFFISFDLETLEKPVQIAEGVFLPLQAGAAAKLNLMAATKSKNTNAFSQALVYLEFGTFYLFLRFPPLVLTPFRLKCFKKMGRTKLARVLRALLCVAPDESWGCGVTRRIQQIRRYLPHPSRKSQNE
jgi:hypothetical protein